MNPGIAGLPAQVAQAVAARIEDDWERILVNCEMKLADEGRLVDHVIFRIKAVTGREFEKVNVHGGSDAIDDAYIALADAMAREGGRCGGCDSTSDPGGRFNFKFSYDPPSASMASLITWPMDASANILTGTAQDAPSRPRGNVHGSECNAARDPTLDIPASCHKAPAREPVSASASRASLPGAVASGKA